MALFTRSIWPDTIKNPYLRLCIALIVAPALMSALLTLLAFFVAGSTASDGETVLDVTLDSAVAIGFLMAGYTLTFGIFGVLVLWALEQAGILAWFMTGIITGAIAGILFGVFAMAGFERGFLVVSASVGGVIMPLIRLIAGIGVRPDTD